MSYNISTMKTKSVSVALPRNFDFEQWVHSLPDRDERSYENVGKRWILENEDCPAIQVVDAATGEWKLSILGKELRGIAIEDTLVVTALRHWTDDCSGYLYTDILLPLFKEFKGNLDALVVWEGGESIVDLKIVEGTVSETSMG